MRTSRRQLLDNFLINAKKYYSGVVLDIGGKKAGKRGIFRPPAENVSVWLYLNIEASGAPDVLARAERIPLADETIDTFLMCEVLEHLAEPEACLAEAARVLKPGGHGLITIPFLYPIHADPFDYQRWTDTRLSMVLSSAGFSIVELKPMGGPLAVIADILQIWLGELPVAFRLRRFAGFAFLSLLKRAFLSDVRLRTHSRITTGFSIIVRKLI